MKKDLTQAAFDYHAKPVPGKISVVPTKPCETQSDLSLAYTPGVAEPVRAIKQDPEAAYRYTNKGNLVAVISNGTAVLGLGNTGALASKPVMEGKAVLFKRLANIDVFDIEIEAATKEIFIETVAAISPTFGAINLEDIAAPDCFHIEEVLRTRLNIPVLHDDQHGTAVIICAALLNAFELQNKKLADVRIVILGAGAAAQATLPLLSLMGITVENILMVDSKGVIHTERNDLGTYKQRFARATSARTLTEAMREADAFIGLSGPQLVIPDMIASMAPRPVIFALANPVPEIYPEIAHAVRRDLIMATGRSDFPNQVNNALGFPYLFRGALDARASGFTQAMLVSAIRALSQLAHEPVPAEVLRAFGEKHLEFGSGYIIPKLLDPRLLETVPPAVVRAAIESGVARAS
jgi:malate dehydrogenase (oxaloacetate-decarboxylating)(NADP+)